MGDADAMEWRRRFDLPPASVRGARAVRRDVAAAVRADPDTAELLASELSTNAVKHAESEFQVRARADHRKLRVEIVNNAPELLVEVKQPSEDGGRGLAIVKELAEDWGTE